MSKASKWTEAVQGLDNTFGPKGPKIGPFQFIVDTNTGGLCLSYNDGFATHLIGCNPRDALYLARWILDTFEDTP